MLTVSPIIRPHSRERKSSIPTAKIAPIAATTQTLRALLRRSRHTLQGTTANQASAIAAIPDVSHIAGSRLGVQPELAPPVTARDKLSKTIAATTCPPINRHAIGLAEREREIR